MGPSSANALAKDIIANLAPFWTTITIVAYLIGFALVIYGLYKLAHGSQGVYGRSVMGGYTAGLLSLIFGSLILTLPTVLNTLTYTVFAQSAPESAIQYAPPNNSATGAEIRLAVLIIHLVGLYAVIKGLYLLAHMHEGRGGEFGSAMWHLVGGALALRVDLFMHLLGTLHSSVLHSVIGQLFP